MLKGVHRPPLIAILGPTAVGKTKIAIQLAERIDGEIVSADSRLFYRGMDIGTAKPTLADRVRVPHYLVDVADPDETWSLATFQETAYQAIDRIHRRGRQPLLVGGTGQYLRAVGEGWLIPKQEPDPRLRTELENWVRMIGPDGLHTRLRVLDPEAAATIDLRNVRRTIRALEVIFHTGKRFSEQRQRGVPRFTILRLGLTRLRPELYQRIDARIDAMLAAGFVTEVQTLLERGYSPDLPSFSAIGYRQIAAHLQGEITLDEAIALIRRQTRQFVRHQANWFKENDPAIQWYSVGPETIDEMVRAILTLLSSKPIL